MTGARGPRAPGARPGLAAGLVLVLVAAGLSLLAGFAVKSHCAGGGASWDDGRQYRRLCYSDIVALYDNQHLASGRLPYLDRCPARSSMCDEYPVLTMYAMRAAAGPVASHRGFFTANALSLGAAALATAFVLWRLVGRRALLFALSPTLVLYGLMNWDLLAVLVATLATAAAVRGRGRLAGLWCGVGAAAKLYPGLLVVPFGLDRLRAAGRKAAVAVGLWAGAAWLALNLPFAVSAFGGWSTFFRFNLARHADFDSLWYVGCQRLVAHQPAGYACPYDRSLNLLSLVAFAGAAVVVYRMRARRFPDFPRWTFGFPLLALFLLTNKVYSPQYSLWLLPWFALVRVRISRWVAFGAVEVLLFVTRFSFLGNFKGVPGLGPAPFQLAVLARAAVLVLFVVDWVRDGRPPSSFDSRNWPSEVPDARSKERAREEEAQKA